MIWIKRICLFLAGFLGSAFVLTQAGDKYTSPETCSVIAFVILLYFDKGLQHWIKKSFFKTKERSVKAVAGGINATKRFQDDILKQVHEGQADFFALAEAEVENDQYDSGLWSKALINAKGDESKRKVEYMKLRVSQLHKKNSPRRAQ